MVLNGPLCTPPVELLYVESYISSSIVSGFFKNDQSEDVAESLEAAEAQHCSQRSAHRAPRASEPTKWEYIHPENLN